MTICARKVCIDYGHDGIDEVGIRDPGAVGPGGTEEATVCRAVAFLLRDILIDQGYEVLLTHEGPSEEVNYLTPRANMANKWGADILISIHANSFGSTEPHGFEVWTTVGQNNSDILADYLYQALEQTGMVGGRPDYTDGDSDKEASFTVIKATWMPSALVELGFISNPEEEQLLASADGQLMYARALAGGIMSYFSGYPKFA